MAESAPNDRKTKGGLHAEIPPDILGNAISEILSRIQVTSDRMDLQIGEQVNEIAKGIDPGFSNILGSLSPQMLEKVLKETADRLFQQSDFLGTATQNAEAASEMMQEALKAVLEGIGEAVGNIN